MVTQMKTFLLTTLLAFAAVAAHGQQVNGLAYCGHCVAPQSSAYGYSNLWVAVGQSSTGGGQVATSPDGITWTLRTNVSDLYPAGFNINLGGSFTPVALTSVATSGAKRSYADINYPSGLDVVFVAVGEHGASWVSADGISWREGSGRGVWGDTLIKNVAYDPVADQYVAIMATAMTNDGTNWFGTATSPDGVTWTPVLGSAVGAAVGYNASNALLVAVGPSGSIQTAPAGAPSAWTPQTSGFSGDIYAIGSDNASVPTSTMLLLAGSSAGKILTSSDGQTWTPRSSGFGNNAVNGIVYANGQYVAVGGGGNIATSPDGVLWTAQSSNFGSNAVNAVAYGNGLYVAVGAGGTLETSPDSITWTAHSNTFSTNSINGVAYNGSLFVAAGNGGVATSPDGTIWTPRTSGISNVSSVAYGNGLLVAIAAGGSSVATSSDGITWASHSVASVLPNGTYSIGYGNGLWMLGSTPGVVATSADGIIWATSTGVGAVTVTNGGSYAATPTIGFTGGGGSGATAVATMSGITASIDVVNHGSGYTFVPTVYIGGSYYTSPTAVAVWLTVQSTIST